MAKNNNLGDFLTDVANAIRDKKGTTAQINAQNFSSEIASIQTGITPTGNIEVQQKTGNDVTNYATASVKSGSASTPTTTITTNPTITIDSNNRLTASYSGSQLVTPTVTSGWIDSGNAGTVYTIGSSYTQFNSIGDENFNSLGTNIKTLKLRYNQTVRINGASYTSFPYNIPGVVLNSGIFYENRAYDNYPTSIPSHFIKKGRKIKLMQADTGTGGTFNTLVYESPVGTAYTHEFISKEEWEHATDLVYIEYYNPDTETASIELRIRNIITGAITNVTIENGTSWEVNKNTFSNIAISIYHDNQELSYIDIYDEDESFYYSLKTGISGYSQYSHFYLFPLYNLHNGNLVYDGTFLLTEDEGY